VAQALTAHSQRILVECDTMLAHILTRYAPALRRLRDAQAGYSARTPGSCEPGAGKGFTAGSITERLATPTPTDRANRADYLNALTLPFTIATAASAASIGAHITIRNVPTDPRPGVQKLRWVAWLIPQLVEQHFEPPNAKLDTLHRRIDWLHRIVTNWGGELVTPKRQPDLIPNDPTEMWCTSCLRIGDKNPRHRGDRCRFCYDWDRTEHFLVPTEILEIRQRRRLTERDVERCRKDWRDKQKTKKRRRAARRDLG
jgi:hypothetical protein